MNRSLLRLLHCPYCGEEIKLSRIVKGSETELIHGLLTCTGCVASFPVVGGIPILFIDDKRVDVGAPTREFILVKGPRVRRLVDMLERGFGDEAFEALLVPPTGRLRHPVFKWLESIPALGRAAPPLERRFARLARRTWRKGLLQRLHDPDGRTTATTVLETFYKTRFPQELGNYFLFRFGQPRYLVALSLARLLPINEGPILDLACGIGQITHYLQSRNPDREVIGIDRNYFELYVAKRFVAPSAEFICYSADQRLPFRDDCFSGAFCSDAFHYFLRRSLAAGEIRRTIRPDGVVVLTRIGNRLVAPNEGYELTPSGYARLFEGIPTRMASEGQLLDRYVKGEGPELEDPPDLPALSERKWLSLVASNRASVLVDHPSLEEWPHAAGNLRVNPLYVVVSSDRNEIEFERRFPSEHYADEDRAMLAYSTPRFRTPLSTLDAIHRGERTPEVEELLRQFLLIGMPARFL